MITPDYTSYIKEQLKLHPSIKARDVLKMCFQGAYGAEHLLTDLERVQDYFLSEYNSCEPSQEPVTEFIASEVCRVNLKAWKKLDLPWQWLFNLFVESASFSDGDARFISYVNEWRNFIDEEITYPTPPVPVHHSQEYRDAEKPAYRVISGPWVRLIPILLQLKGEGIIAIDGRSASGKTTLGAGLKSVIGAEVVHMDDFFLPPELRTPERLNQPGGNVHYERFIQEVLPFIGNKNVGFEYKVFDCKTMAYNGVRKIKPSKWRVVEGAYSMHPEFKNYMNVPVFSDIDPVTQMERIKNRNGDTVAKIYEEKWIPMEEKYISSCLQDFN